ncbi:MAG: ABC transporter permease [Prevotellaceae bacterium]|nr:ABC transporter permease [Prevotellaceae bacterium]
MNKTLIIIEREFTTRVHKKSFILLTVLMPFVFAALIFVPVALAQIKDDGQKSVALIDHTGRYAREFTDDASWRFVPETQLEPGADYEATIVISADLAANPSAVQIYSEKEVSPDLLRLVSSRLDERLRQDRLAASGIAGLEDIVAELEKGVNVRTVKWNADGGETSSNTYVAMGAGFLFTFLIYMFVMAYGAMVMQSVLEEKTGRIVELMVSSVKPFQLMLGKVVGVALVGFVQLIVWGVMLAAIIAAASIFFGASPELSSPAAGVPAPQAEAAQAVAAGEGAEVLEALLNLPYLEMGIMFVCCFAGGYLLYASFYAAVGASVSSQEDSSQFVTPMVLIMVFGLYAAMYSIENTDGPLAFWASLFPLTSPIVMMVRVPFGVPLWQEVLSVALLFGSALGMIWIAGRIYRVGILMYGKKPTLREMIRWIRYK